MGNNLSLLAAALLFLVGMRLAAFFSGSEIGFYRASFLRVSIDAHAGDRIASRLLWFLQNPSYFVATTLVGNNVAHYIITLAIGMAAVSIFHTEGGWVEVASTVLFAPVIFIFGELVPKNLYYRAPLTLLRRDAAWFMLFYRLLYVFSVPLVYVSKIFERFSRAEALPTELVLGRSRLVHVLRQGHSEGLLSDVQSQMAGGLMQMASHSVSESATSIDRVLGVSDDTPRAALLDFATKFGLKQVAVKRAHSKDAWYGYVRVVDVAVSAKLVVDCVLAMPRIEAQSSKLEALIALRDSDRAYGAVYEGDRLRGVVTQRGLVEQFFRPVQSTTTLAHTP